MASARQIPYRMLGVLLAVALAVIVPFLLCGEAVTAWTGRLIEGAEERPFHAAAFLLLLLASDIVMPVPSSLVSTACGLTLGFAGGTAVSFAGMTVTAAAGYFIGRFASAPAEQLIGSGEVALLKGFQERYGLMFLLAMRPVPVLAEASVVFSGLSRQPLRRVLAVTAAGNLAVSAVYAAVGTWGRLSDSFLPAFGASVALSGVLMVWARHGRKGTVGS